MPSGRALDDRDHVHRAARHHHVTDFAGVGAARDLLRTGNARGAGIAELAADRGHLVGQAGHGHSGIDLAHLRDAFARVQADDRCVERAGTRATGVECGIGCVGHGVDLIDEFKGESAQRLFSADEVGTLSVMRAVR